MEAQQFFAGEKSTATTEALPLVGDSWALGDEDAVAEEDEGLECNDESSRVLDMQVSPHPEVAVSPSMNADDNIDPALRLISTSQYDPSVFAATPISPPASIYSKVTASTTTGFSETFSQSVPADITSPSTTGVLKSLSSHAVKVGATTSAGKDKGKEKVTTDTNSMSLGIPPRAPSSSGSSAARKRLRDPGSDISSKLSKASNSLVQQIQNSAEAKSESKRMRIQAEIVGKELRARDKNAQREHELKMKMVGNEHELSMAGEKTKQLELELKLEQAKIARLEAERRFSAAEEMD
ncbi:hypothetical protein PISMIDRAFT_17701 [Pisolithus microcarpus 441]|uniref:Unplaced genomic scaffold scaffold_287, whole genome shotgun sequence n=1 Tax=Pisolithus microcarpus 441 TaxID=765257 RepID=A0A0C9YU78_9AGAM|nr:hypothetical protein PISMIDRAFT_17701 [Pisolithus microcarpus 441]